MSWFKMRSNQLILFVMLLLVALGVRLFMLTGVEHKQWVQAANSDIIRNIVTPAPRGEIFDRNGILIAGNKQTFVVAFAKNDMNNAQLNESISKLLKILDMDKQKTVDNLPIQLTSDGKFYYTYQTEITQWLQSHHFPISFTAAQAFDELRRQNNIDPGMDKFEAQKKLMYTYGVYPPINIGTFEYTQEQDKRNFLSLYGITDFSMTAEGAFDYIRDAMGIDPSLSVKAARRIMTIRYELSAQGAYKYVPVKIAAGLDRNTVIRLEEDQQDLNGVSVYNDSYRYYPQGDTACHVIGYLGRMSESNWQSTYKNKPGYLRSDMIGLDGIEQSQESVLKGINGEKRIQINAVGETTAVLGDKKAKKGKDIVLTLDLRLQQVAEDALQRDLTAVRTGGLFTSKYGSYRITQAAPHAQVGAAVVVKVKTGEPLAIATVPGFDPNDFAQGISVKQWNAYQGTNPRDPLSPRPLYNVAAMTAVQPGSTFKPITAITALQAGLNPNQTLYDAGHIVLGGNSFGCMLWNTSKGTMTHGYENLYKAMEVSCNYYFFDIGTGMDWANHRASLGYKISIGKIMGYAKQFGLGIKSGVEIPETTVSTPTAAKKMESTKMMLQNFLIGQAEYIFKKRALTDYDMLMSEVNTITGWIQENPSKVEIENRLLKLDVKPAQAASLAAQIKYNYFEIAKWTIGDALNIAIGQGENAYTPIQMARYIATIGNHGKLNNLSIIKAMEGEGAIPRQAPVKAKVKQGNLNDVMHGMSLVVAGGTLNNLTSLKMSVVGKSGTAQRSGRINPPDEVKYMKQHLKAINPKLKWSKVNAEMARIMKLYPEIYDNPNTAVRQAVVNLSGQKFHTARLDLYKPKYDDFAWVMAMAPADNPEVAVVCLIVQGGASRNCIPVVKELLGQYFDIKKADQAKKAMNYTKFFANDKSSGRIRLDYLHKGTSKSGTNSAIGSPGSSNVGDNVGLTAID